MREGGRLLLPTQSGAVQDRRTEAWFHSVPFHSTLLYSTPLHSRGRRARARGSQTPVHPSIHSFLSALSFRSVTGRPSFQVRPARPRRKARKREEKRPDRARAPPQSRGLALTFESQVKLYRRGGKTAAGIRRSPAGRTDAHAMAATMGLQQACALSVMQHCSKHTHIRIPALFPRSHARNSPPASPLRARGDHPHMAGGVNRRRAVGQTAKDQAVEQRNQRSTTRFSLLSSTTRAQNFKPKSIKRTIAPPQPLPPTPGSCLHRAFRFFSPLVFFFFKQCPTTRSALFD